MRDRHSVALSPPAALWPPDDTEESVLGTNLHQTTITNLRLGLNEAAGMLTPPGGPPPWQALSQTMLSGLERQDGSSYTVLPDVFVYRRPIALERASVALGTDGPPALIVEVASEATYRSDLDLVRGKGAAYARAGVLEYLVLDPTGEWLTEPVRAWRLERCAYRTWLPDAAGRWQSRQLAVAIALEGAAVVVHTPDGRRQLREGEITQAVVRLEQQIAKRDELIAGQDEEIAKRDELIAKRDELIAGQGEEIAALRRRLGQVEHGE